MIQEQFQYNTTKYGKSKRESSLNKFSNGRPNLNQYEDGRDDYLKYRNDS